MNDVLSRERTPPDGRLDGPVALVGFGSVLVGGLLLAWATVRRATEIVQRGG